MWGRVWFQQSWDQRTGPFLLLLLVIIAAGICWKFPLRNAADVLHAGFWIMTADLCLATTVHPWYLSWGSPGTPGFPLPFACSMWTGAVFLSYLAYQYRPVHEQVWPLLIQYLPMYALMAYEIYRGGPLLATPVRSKRAVKRKYYLDLTLKEDIVEGRPECSFFSRRHRIACLDVLERVHHAAAMKSVIAMVLHLNERVAGWARLSELRRALLAFRLTA